MKYLLSFVISIFIILTGCASQSQENSSGSIISSEGKSSSYQAILRIKGAEYISVGNINNGKYTIGKEIGKVEKKVPPEVLPKVNFVSNYLNEGTTIYSVKEDADIFLVETEEGTYEVFEKSN